MKRPMSALFAGFAALVLTGAVAAPAYAAPERPADQPTSGWYAVLPETGAVFNPETSDIWSSQPAPEGEVGPMLLDPVSWAQCHTLKNQTWKIVSAKFAWDGKEKDMALQCGKEKSPGGQGWHHIRYGHMDQWKDRITQAKPNASTDPWDDLMWFAASYSLGAQWSSSGPVNDKLCISAKVEMFNEKNVKVYTFYPTFHWSLNNNRLITAYPSSKPDC